MSVVSIVISAVNKTKAVFQDVGNQVVALNKKVDRAAKLMRGLFVAGFAASMIRSLLGATTQTEKLEQATKNAKESFSPLIQTISDGLVDIISELQEPIRTVGSFLSKITSGIQYAAAYAAALIETGSHQAAKAIADQTVLELESERKLRALAAERAKADEENRKKIAEEQERALEEEKKRQGELQKIKEDNEKKAIDLYEDGLSRRELLEKKLHELRKAQIAIEFAEIKKNEKERLEAEGRVLDLTKQIKGIKEDISKSESENAEKSVDEEKQNIKKTTEEKIGGLQEERSRLLEQQKELESVAEEKRKLALDPESLKEFTKQAEQRIEDQKEFERILLTAKKRAESGTDISRRLTAAEQMAIQSESARLEAERVAAQAEAKRQEIEKAQIESEKHLKSIDAQISDALTFTR